MLGKSLADRIEELSRVMNDLGFQVKTVRDSETQESELQAFNCIYHDLAQKHHEICEFDLALMSSVLDKEVEQLSCMAKGDCVCRFKVKG
jgi:predicted ArsR family transcriptional regulator